mgnify:CR=1 FL=1
MTYEEFINNILETRGRNGCGEEYHETHHIVPKCMGGSNDKENLIDLFAREHFEAHRLLALENPNIQGLVYAWWAMSVQTNEYTKERYHITAEEYEEVRKAYSKTMSKCMKERMSGENNPMYGKCGELNPMYGIHRYGEENPMFGKQHSEKAKNKMKDSWDYDKHFNQKTREKLSKSNGGENNPMFGKAHTEEAKKKNMMSQKTRRSVICEETGQKYNSQNEVAKKLNINVGSVSYAIKHHNVLFGYHYIYAVDTKQNDLKGEE